MPSSTEREIIVCRKDKESAAQRGDLKGLAICCNALGNLYSQLKQYEEALSEHQQELTASDAAGDKLGVAVAHRKIGEALFELEKFSEALNHFNRYLAKAKECGSLVEQQRAWATIAKYCLDRDKLDQAEKALHKALRMCDRMMSDPSTVESSAEVTTMKARVLANLGVVARERGDWLQAVNLHTKGLELVEGLVVSNWEVFKCHYDLAGDYRLGKKYYQALEHAEKAIKILDKARRSKRSSSIQDDLYFALVLKGEIEVALQNYDDAKGALHRAYKMNPNSECGEYLKNVVLVRRLRSKLFALKQMPDADHSEILKVHERLGDTLVGLKGFDEAIINYQAALEMSAVMNKPESWKRGLYFSLARTYEDKEMWLEALSYHRRELRAIGTENPKEACKTLLNIALASEKAGDDVDSVMEMYDRALKEAEASQEPKLKRTVLKNLLTMLKETGRTEDAEATSRQLEDLRSKYRWKSNEEDEEDEDDDGVQEAEDDEGDVDLENLSDDPEDQPSDTEEGALADMDEDDGTRKRRRSVIKSFQKPNAQGETPLQVACRKGNLTEVQSLINQGHQVNVYDNLGWSALHEAANFNFHEIIVLLLSKGAQVNDVGVREVRSRRFTPLHDAARNGCYQALKVLVEGGADIHARTRKGVTPLDYLYKYVDKYHQDRTPEQEECFREAERLLGGPREKVCISDSSDDEFDAEAEAKSVLSGRMKGRASVGAVAGEEVGVPMDSESLIPAAVTPRHVPEGRRRNRGVKEYQEAILGVRHPAKPPEELSAKRKRKKETRCFIPAKENPVTGDDWLIDDLPAKTSKSSNEKRRRVEDSCSESFRPIMTSTQREPERQCPVTTSDPSINPRQEQFLDDLWEDQEADELLLAAATSVVTESDHGPGPPLPALQQPDRQAQGVAAVAPSSALPSQGSGPLKVKVRVDGDLLLLIPVTTGPTGEQRNIEWLQKETERRYFTAKGSRPIVTLVTQDGAALDPCDLVVDVLTPGEEIRAHIQDWSASLLSEKYSDLCSTTGITPVPRLVKPIEESASTMVLDLAYLAPPIAHLKVLSRSLQRQQNLQELNLSHCKLRDEGVQVLSSSLGTLPNLRRLDLSGNLISGLGVEHLASGIQGSRLQQGTEVLKHFTWLGLSHNPLFPSGGAVPLNRLLQCLSEQLLELHLNDSALHDKDLMENVLLGQMTAFARTMKGLKLTCLSMELNPCLSLDVVAACLPRTLTSLALGGVCNSSERPGSPVARFLKDSTRLAAISLVATPLKEVDCISISRAGPYPWVKQLKLSHCQTVEPSGLRRLLDSFPSLAVCEVKGILSHGSDEGDEMSKLKLNFPRVNIVSC